MFLLSSARSTVFLRSHSRFAPRIYSQPNALAFVFMALALVVFFEGNTLANPAPSDQTAAKILATPMHFEINAGQTAESVNFVSRGPGYTLFLTPNEAVLTLRQIRNKDQSRREQAKESQIRMKLLRANPQPQPKGLDPLPGTANYFVGGNPDRWRSAIAMFGKVNYEEVYPGIDLVYYGNQRQL